MILFYSELMLKLTETYTILPILLQIHLPNLSLCFIRDVYMLIILHILEEVINLKKEMKGMKQDINFMSEAVTDIRKAEKDTNVVKKDVTEAICKRNGEFYLIGFCFVLNKIMN